MEKGIIVVSFGTSYKETREKCIESIENKIGETFTNYRIARAFTSNMVIKKLKERDGLHIHTPHEALDAMINDGIKEIHVQPLHVIPGFEYEKVRKAVIFANHTNDIKVTIGSPLLNEEKHYDEVIEALCARLPEPRENNGIILMGHGTEHHANACYSMLQAKLNDERMDVHIANVEGYPELDHILEKVKRYKEITLMPLMIVAGDHAQNDMAGDDDDSYKSILESKNIEVSCILEGLGENKGIQDAFINRINDVIEE